ncbi:MAG: hypothetical protein MUE81_00980 [Thermoflexibacter sp.]|jgi:hypothetical protein|nr:hypothetical protein [Thermoflexibacter sp.]
MRYIKILSLFLTLGLFTGACKTEMIEQIDVFSLQTGAYMRHLTPWPFGTLTFSKATLSAGQIAFSLEAVDAQRGTLFASYDLTARFVDRTPANGTNSVANRAFITIPASSFSPDASSGYPRGSMTIRAADLIRTLGLTEANVSPTDAFEIEGVMRLTDGRSFSERTSDPDILGGNFYRSPFFYRIIIGN